MSQTRKPQITIGEYQKARNSPMAGDVKTRIDRAWKAPKSVTAMANELGLTDQQVLACVYSNPKRFLLKDELIHRI